ncbi:MAG: FGGY family carbohydrate kinase [Ginsengibacter sp.]
MKVTAIFDIGKTNKKFYLFDENYTEVFKEYITIDEIKDDDDDPCDNLMAIENWIKEQLKNIIENKKFEITAVNFSTYGASFVHIDENGIPLTPLYNYLKPYPKKILNSFYDKYGDEMAFAAQTASPPLAMLNSGLQLYWLKYDRPEIFKKIKWSLHLPQYFSYIFSCVPVSEYSSIGCHTGLWDFNKHDYHAWIYEEGIDKILPPIVTTDTTFKSEIAGQVMQIGAGIHDSSAALLPYTLSDAESFLLISTGTWSISLNPFSEQILTGDDLQNDCLNFMRTDGKTVRASRLLLGKEYDLQTDKLASHFNKASDYHKTIQVDDILLQQLLKKNSSYFHFEYIPPQNSQPSKTDYTKFSSYKEAYHQFMIELLELQAQSSKRAIKETPIKKIYIDGGFADNDLFIKLLTHHFPQYPIYTTQSSLGSSLGAAMIMQGEKTNADFLKDYYAMRKHNAPA